MIELAAGLSPARRRELWRARVHRGRSAARDREEARAARAHGRGPRGAREARLSPVTSRRSSCPPADVVIAEGLLMYLDGERAAGCSRRSPAPRFIFDLVPASEEPRAGSRRQVARGGDEAVHRRTQRSSATRARASRSSTSLHAAGFSDCRACSRPRRRARVAAAARRSRDDDGRVQRVASHSRVNAALAS